MTAAGVRQRIDAFLYAPTTGETGAAFRIATGAVTVYLLVVHVGWNLERYYGDAGSFPRTAFLATETSHLTPLAWTGSHGLLIAVWVATLVGALALTMGAATRAAAMLSYAGLVSLHNRNPFLMTSGDQLLVAFTFLCVFAPVALRGSVDAWYCARRRAAAPALAEVTGLAIVRLVVCFTYFASFVSKMSHDAWRRGDALRLILESRRFAVVPHLLDGTPALARVLTWGTLLFEGAFALALVKRYRPYVLAAGLALHLGIEVVMKIPIFGAVMAVGYVALLDDDEVRWAVTVLGRIRDQALRRQ